MQITVWSNFSKRRNSTKQPTGGTSKTVLLKDATDIENPVFILNTTDMSINYVQAFGHYYFAKCRNLDGSRTEIICSMDHLASYKTDISTYSGFVEYTSSSSRVDILDPRNRPTVAPKVSYSQALTGLDLTVAGTYILGVVAGNASHHTGFPTYYAMPPALMNTFLSRFFDQAILEQIIDDFTAAMESIVSCIWLPFDYTQLTGAFNAPEQIYIGSKGITDSNGNAVSAATINNRIYAASSGNYIDLPLTFPYAGQTYLNRSPYSTGTLFLPFVGSVPLDVDIVAGADGYSFKMYIDLITGDVLYDQFYDDGLSLNRIATFSGNCATKVPVSGLSYDGIGVASGTMVAAGGIATAIGTALTGGAAGAIAGGLAAAAGGAAQSVTSTKKHAIINGAASSGLGAQLGNTIIATIVTSIPAETDLDSFQAEQGMPYFQTATIGNLSGYVRCSDASVAISGSEEDKQAVNNYLNTGFYYE